MIWLEVDGEMEHSSFIRGASRAPYVAVPLGEIVHQGGHGNIGQGAVEKRRGGRE